MKASFIKEPVFLVGAERSGTTLLRLMLKSHPQLAWCNEFEYTVDLISEEGKFPSLDVYYSWLETHRIFQATGFKIDRNLDYPQLVNSFLVQQQNNTKKPLIGATIHRHFDRSINIWSDAKFIHIVRDGRDVARSRIGMGWAGNVWVGVEGWIAAENLWAKFSQSLPPERKIELSYESLITKPKATLQDLCDFIGITFDPAMLNYDRWSTYDKPDSSLVQQWKKKLSTEEIQLIEVKISQMLLERNYQLSGLPPIKVNYAKKQQLKFTNWSKKLKFRIDRYGLPLLIVDNISRRLKFNSWQKNIKLKLNSIDKLYLK